MTKIMISCERYDMKIRWSCSGDDWEQRLPIASENCVCCSQKSTWLLNRSFFKCISSVSLSSGSLMSKFFARFCLAELLLTRRVYHDWYEATFVQLSVHRASDQRDVEERRMKTGAGQQIRSYHCLFSSFSRLPSVADIVNKYYLGCWPNNKRIVSGGVIVLLSAANARTHARARSCHMRIRSERYNNVA